MRVKGSDFSESGDSSPLNLPVLERARTPWDVRENIHKEAVQDWHDKAVGKVISSNSAEMFTFWQNQTPKNCGSEGTLKSVHAEKGVFSEVFVCVGRLLYFARPNLTTLENVNEIKGNQTAGRIFGMQSTRLSGNEKVNDGIEKATE